MKGLQDSEALGRGSLRSSITSEAISMTVAGEAGVCHHKAQMLFEDSRLPLGLTGHT